MQCRIIDLVILSLAPPLQGCHRHCPRMELSLRANDMGPNRAEQEMEVWVLLSPAPQYWTADPLGGRL